MNDQIELWSLPWHLLQRSLAKELQPVFKPVDPTELSQSASRSLSWLARARAPVHFVARRGQ